MDLINGNEIAKIIIEELKTRVENFKDGKPIGLYFDYHENGRLHRTGFYINGKAEGEFKRYYDNGDLHKEGMCENDNCILKVYDKTGKLTSQETWEGNEKVNEIFY